ncbi:MAG TPA: DUF1810 domain-containing protein [Croceibacterium sp.]
MSEFDPLQRFVDAQEPVYAQALAELQAGDKRSHWMWFVFPQIGGLGHSAPAQFYAIRGREEADAYSRHPLLGARLRECTAAMLGWAGRRGAERILGPVDAVKFRSAMTLFEACADDPSPFSEAIEAFYGGERDQATLERL